MGGGGQAHGREGVGQGDCVAGSRDAAGGSPGGGAVRIILGGGGGGGGGDQVCH